MDKSKYQEVGGNVDRMWQQKGEVLTIGDAVEGRYIQRIENQGPKGNSNVYVLEETNGKTVGVWGSVVLDDRFKTIAIGKIVGIEYLGKKKTKDGSGSYNDFFVGVGIDSIGDEGFDHKRKNGDQPIPVINLDEEPEDDAPF
jgi:hypothetical protein